MKRHMIMLALLVTLPCSTLLFTGLTSYKADPIATFQGNLQRTGVIDATPVKLINKIRWKFKTDGFVFTSPTIYDNILYFGSDDDCLYSVDAYNGRLLWRFVTKGAIRATPFVTKKHVYLPSEDGNLYKLDAATGKELWHFTSKEMLTKNKSSDIAIASSPAVWNNTVYYGSYDGTLYALDTDTGTVQWKYTTDASLKSSPSIYEGNVYFTSLNGKLYCVDAKTGKLQWTHSTSPANNNSKAQFISSPAIQGGVVYIGGLDFYLYALDTQTGKVKWKKYLSDQPVFSTICVGKDKLFFGTQSGHNSKVYAFDLKGKQKWFYENNDKNTLDQSNIAKNGNLHFENQLFVASPITTSGFVYAGSWDGKLYAFDTDTGAIKWSYETGGPIAGSVALLDGIIYVGSYDSYLYALNK